MTRTQPAYPVPVRSSFVLVCALGLPVFSAPHPFTPTGQTTPTAETSLRDRVEATPRLSLQPETVTVHLPPGRKLGMVSWMAQNPRTHTIWILQRGTDVSPILGVAPNGRIVHAFGDGAFSLPHAIRLDRNGDLWTVDAGSSQVIRWSPTGKRLLTLRLSHPPVDNGFSGATDIAFAPAGQILVSDGYGNARIVEYTPQGQPLRTWGSAGRAPGQFHLPHSIVVDEHGVIYVADRENGRIERFNLNGRLLGQWADLGRVYALALTPGGTLWATVSPMDQPPGSPGWILKLDRTSGKLLGYVPVPDQGGLHGLATDAQGQPLTDVGNQVLRFRSPVAVHPAR